MSSSSTIFALATAAAPRVFRLLTAISSVKAISYDEGAHLATKISRKARGEVGSMTHSISIAKMPSDRECSDSSPRSAASAFKQRQATTDLSTSCHHISSHGTLSPCHRIGRQQVHACSEDTSSTMPEPCSAEQLSGLGCVKRSRYEAHPSRTPRVSLPTTPAPGQTILTPNVHHNRIEPASHRPIPHESHAIGLQQTPLATHAINATAGALQGPHSFLIPTGSRTMRRWSRTVVA